MDNVPPGMGAEDFGGSICATRDGQLYVQAGKTAFINLKVVGLETVKKLANGEIRVSNGDLAQAQKFRDALAQLEGGEKLTAVPAKTIAFTGDASKDFGSDGVVTFTKNDAKVAALIAHDDANLYLAWSVNDATPWLNGAPTRSACMPRAILWISSLALIQRPTPAYGCRGRRPAPVHRQLPGKADRRPVPSDFC